MAAGIRTVSQDGSTAVATVVFDLPLMEVPHETKTAVGDAVRAEPVPGVGIELSSELVRQMPGAGPGEVLGLVVAAVALVVMLGTLVAAGLPLLVALLGVGISALGALAFSGTVEMMAVTPMLGIMLGLAVGIDYSLFIINRHRRELRLGLELHESVGLANGTSGNAVVFAGSTVLVALLALNLTGIPFLGLMGTVAAVSVATAVLVAVTLTPALLGLIGHRVLPRRQRHAEPDHSVLATPAPMSTPRAVLRLVVGVTALLLLRSHNSYFVLSGAASAAVMAVPALVALALRLRQFGQEIIEVLGGKKIHPAWAVPGGVRSALTEEGRARIRTRLRVPDAIDVCHAAGVDARANDKPVDFGARFEQLHALLESLCSTRANDVMGQSVFVIGLQVLCWLLTYLRADD